MRPISTTLLVKVSELKKNPTKIKMEAGLAPVAVISQNQPLFYLVDPTVYERLIRQQAANPELSPLLKQQDYLFDVPSQQAGNITFKELLPKVLSIEESRVLRGELSAKALKITCYRLDKLVLPYFGDLGVGAINAELLERFVSLLSSQGIGSVSIGQYLVIVRKVLKLAYAHDRIRVLPNFPSVSNKRTSRGGFTLTEYHKLLQTSWQMRGQVFAFDRASQLDAIGLDARKLVMGREMHRLIGFMVNGFMRPSDIKFIKHKHVEVMARDSTYLKLTLPETKKHDKPIVTMRSAVYIYQRILRDAERQGYGGPDDYVFMPELQNRSHVLRVLGFLFNWLLEETGLKQGPHGIGRSLYSLRHTSITFRLLYGQGIDVLTLARNARTSVNMIERHYASTLNGEMNIALIQSKRRRAP